MGRKNRLKQKIMNQNYFAVTLIVTTFFLLLLGCAKSPPPREELPPIIELNIKTTQQIEVALSDINQMPITLWILEEDGETVGFFLTGHAELPICQIASHQLFTTLMDIGLTSTDVFGAGVGFSLRSKDDVQFAVYNAKLREMVTQFESLDDIAKISQAQGVVGAKIETKALTNRDQVEIRRVNARWYIEMQEKIQNHIQAAKNASWPISVVEYQLEKGEDRNTGPILVPYYDIINQDAVLKFTLTDELLSMPEELSMAYVMDLYREAERTLEERKKNNEGVLGKLAGFLKGSVVYSGAMSQFSVFEIQDLDKTIIYTLEIFMKFYDQFGNEVEFVPPDSIINVTIEKGLEDTLNRIQKLAMKANQRISEKLSELLAFKQRALKAERINTAILIDSFLRGWRLSFDTDTNNDRFDQWVELRRVKIWNQILDNLSQAGLKVRNDRLAGLFHEENVVFQMNPVEGGYEITPYQVLADEFLQIIDKDAGVCYFASVYTNRFP